MPAKQTRRRFLKLSTAAALSPMIVPARAILRAADGTPPPSDRLTIGFIGVGKQGTNHLTAIARRSDINILAIADVQEERRNNARDVIEKATGVTPTDKKKDDLGGTSNSPWVVQEGALSSAGKGG